MTDKLNTADPSKSLPKFWKAALLLAGSAAFGGLAVVLWNRRELALMHNTRENLTPEESSAGERSDDEIF